MFLSYVSVCPATQMSQACSELLVVCPQHACRAEARRTRKTSLLLVCLTPLGILVQFVAFYCHVRVTDLLDKHQSLLPKDVLLLTLFACQPVTLNFAMPSPTNWCQPSIYLATTCCIDKQSHGNLQHNPHGIVPPRTNDSDSVKPKGICELILHYRIQQNDVDVNDDSKEARKCTVK